MNELERSLTALGRVLEVPEAPDLAPAVRARIEAQEPARRRALRSRRWVLVVALAMLAVLAATLAVPNARSALFRVLQIGGERIELVDELPEIPVAAEVEVLLGEPVTLEEARRRSGVGLRELDEAPDGVYLGGRGTVWFRYGEPESIRLLVAQTPLASLDENLLLKKLAGPDTQVEQVDVDGATGVFISGMAHLVFLYDENGLLVEDGARLARDVLVWERGGVAYRLEGDFSREDALELAAELQ
ncbi:MAG: hypothetical protein ACRDNY_06105 [Gaiellaceae bacterium]